METWYCKISREEKGGEMNKELVEKLADFLLELYYNNAMHPLKTGRIAEKIIAFFEREGYVILHKNTIKKAVGLAFAEKLGVK